MNAKTAQVQSLLSSNFLNFTPLICAMMVILIHVFGGVYLSDGGVSARIVGFVAHGICTAAVPMFFFVSGYLFFRDVEGLGQVFEKQKRRMVSTVMPFLAWSTFYWLLYAVGTTVIPGLQTTVDFSVPGILGGIIFYRYCFPMWYMFQLCLYVLLAPLLFYLLKNKVVGAGVFAVAAAVGMFFCESVEIYVGDMKRDLFAFNFFAYYFLGCLTARVPGLQTAIQTLANKLPLAISAAALVACGFVESLFFDEVIVAFNSRCMVPFVFVFLLLALLKLCSTRKKLPKASVSTMILYGIHPLCGVVLGRLVLGRIQLPNAAHYFLSFACVAALSWAVGLVMKQIKPIYAVFSGNR